VLAEIIMKSQHNTDTEDSDTVQAIDPHTHELEAFLQYTRENLTPYYQLLEILKKNDEYVFTDIDVSAETYDIEISSHKTGFVQNGEREPKIVINFALQDDTLGIKSGTFQIKPRRVNASSIEGAENPSNPDYNDGDPYFTVGVDGSNIAKQTYLEILQSVFDYFNIDIDTTELHSSSTSYSLSQEVRVDREVISRLIGHESTFSKIKEYVNTDGHLSRSNGNISSRREEIYLDSEAVNQLVNGHEYGKSLKLYSVKHPPDDPDDPLHHPKLCVMLDDNVSWSDIPKAKNELNELLINILSWSGISIQSGDPFISDSYFENTNTTHEIDLLESPIAEIKKTQQAFIDGLSFNPDITESQRGLLETLATCDSPTVREIADTTDVSKKTVYRSINGFENVVSLDNGTVEFASECLESGISSFISKATNRVKDTSSTTSPFKKFANTYGVSVSEKDGRMMLRFGEIPRKVHNNMNEILDRALTAWIKSDNRRKKLEFAHAYWSVNGQSHIKQGLG
jgi:hypothetical protein